MSQPKCPICETTMAEIDEFLAMCDNPDCENYGIEFDLSGEPHTGYIEPDEEVYYGNGNEYNWDTDEYNGSDED
jgi:hypothetical protein